MNEQKDKLLINLVEPGRIGRTPFNSFFSLSSLFRMGELVKKKRIDGGCGGSGNEAWLGWIVFWWVIGGGSRRQPAKREDEQAKRNVFLLFHLHQLWMKRIIDWEMEWRDEIEEQTKPTHSSLFNSSTTLSFVAVAGKANKRVEFAVGLFESGKKWNQSPQQWRIELLGVMGRRPSPQKNKPATSLFIHLLSCLLWLSCLCWREDKRCGWVSFILLVSFALFLSSLVID